MFIFNVLLLLIASSLSQVTGEYYKYNVTWYDQKVDHFNYVIDDTYKQRIIVSTEHWADARSPILFYAGNEGDITNFAKNTGFIWDLAPTFKAMVVFSEHRYYGESLPYGNQSFTRENLGYLSAEQALADYAEVIMWIKSDRSPFRGVNNPVIVFGGSYGGMLAAWFRMKYPHLTIGALAASAPIWQFPGIYDCHKFFQVTSDDFKKYSPNCEESIRKSWAALRRLGSSSTGKAWISSNFHLCRGIESSKDLDIFISWLTSIYVNLAMTDYPNPANFLRPMPAYPINATCQRIKKPNQDDKSLLKDIHHGLSIYYNYTGKTKCNNFEMDSSNLGADGWDYQSCTEMVMPACSDGVSDMFEKSDFNVTQIEDTCMKIYGVKPESGKIEMMFGGKNIQAASKIIFSNGGRDPWYPGGVLENLSDTLTAIHIPNACHHEDLRTRGKWDPIALIAARAQEKDIMTKWLNDFYGFTFVN